MKCFWHDKRSLFFLRHVKTNFGKSNFAPKQKFPLRKGCENSRGRILNYLTDVPAACMLRFIGLFSFTVSIVIKFHRYFRYLSEVCCAECPLRLADQVVLISMDMWTQHTKKEWPRKNVWISVPMVRIANSTNYNHILIHGPCGKFRDICRLRWVFWLSLSCAFAWIVIVHGVADTA